MRKKAELFTPEKLIDLLEEKGKELDYKVNVDIEYDIENTATISFYSNEKDVILSVVVLYGRIYTEINIFDKKGNNILHESVKTDKFDIKEYQKVINKVKEELNKNLQYVLNTPEKIYDYGEENNWQGITNKQYEILSQNVSFARMAVADMQDKGIVVPEILKKFRRYSMSFKDFVAKKIAKDQTIKKQIKKVANLNKKATEEDIKLKVQKNKPTGLDTSSPQILEGKAKKVFEDMMAAYSNVQEVKADIEKFKAKTDKLIQKKIQKVGLDEKTAKLQELVNKSAQLVSKMENTTFQNADKLGVFVNKTQVVPKKFSDKEKIAKLMEYIDKELGKGRAEQYLKNAENGLQSQAAEKAIRELVVFEPTKQKKTSDTHDEESSIDTLIDTMKDVYTNLRNYYLSMVKTNNIIEEELLPTVGATASKNNNVSKKAKMHKKAGESGGWVVNPDEAFDKLDLFVQAFGAETALDALARSMGTDELSENLAYIFRMYDFQEGDSNYVEEDTEIESKKKANLKAKKVKTLNKKAGKMVKVEMPLTIYMANLEDRAKEQWNRELPLKDELANYLSEFDYVPQEYIVVDNYLINGQFADKETWQEDFEDEYKKYNGDWNMFCENKAVFYNDEEACLNLGE